MSTRYKNGSDYRNHPRTAELHGADAHPRRAARRNGSEHRLTGHEPSRQALDHPQKAYGLLFATAHDGAAAPGYDHEEVAVRAYELWASRGYPEGSAQDDWLRAVDEVRARSGPSA